MKSNRFLPSFGERVYQEAVALAVLGQLDHAVGVEAVIERVVGEQRSDQLRRGPLQRLARRLQRLDSEVVPPSVMKPTFTDVASSCPAA